MTIDNTSSGNEASPCASELRCQRADMIIEFFNFSVIDDEIESRIDFMLFNTLNLPRPSQPQTNLQLDISSSLTSLTKKLCDIRQTEVTKK